MAGHTPYAFRRTFAHPEDVLLGMFVFYFRLGRGLEPRFGRHGWGRKVRARKKLTSRAWRVWRRAAGRMARRHGWPARRPGEPARPPGGNPPFLT